MRKLFGSALKPGATYTRACNTAQNNLVQRGALAGHWGEILIGIGGALVGIGGHWLHMDADMLATPAIKQCVKIHNNTYPENFHGGL